IDHEVEGRYYRDEGTYYHHAAEINSGKPLRLSFVYPHLTYYLDAFVLWGAGLFPGAAAAWAEEVYGVRADDPLNVAWLLLRTVVAVLSALTVVPVYRIAERFGGTLAGAAAGLLVIFSPLYNDGSHLNISDVPSAFFATVCLYFVARLVDGESTRDYLLAGVFAGLAAASKYPAGVVAVAIVGVWLLWRRERRDFRPGLLWAGLAALGTFVAAMPSLLAYPEAAFFGGRGMFFGVRQYGRGGWLGVVPASNTLFYARQLAESFGVAALVAGVTGWAALARPRRLRLLWLLPFPVAYLALIASMSMVVKRNLYPALPVLAALLGIGIAAWLAALIQEGPLFRAAATVLVLVTFVPVLVRTARQDLGLARASTRELAAEWVRANVPRGVAIVKETYTPSLPEGEYEVAHRRFAARVPLAELRDGRYDYVLLASASYARFLRPEALRQRHHQEMARTYAEIFRSFELVREWVPGRSRLGPVLRLYRIPEPADCGRWPDGVTVVPAGRAFVPDHGMRTKGEPPVRYDVGGQWSLFKACLEPGRHRLTLRGKIVPRGPGEPGGNVRVEHLTRGLVADVPLEDGARVSVEVPARGKLLFYVYLPPGSRLRGVVVERSTAPSLPDP
ncbi:MAG TPA: glycosyltransferase family 39 protein, partial [Thermoanaerobaculia bacterium]|nr:glycosyltransferase family 39 protein [Thermoanaerobaculia bacterium]